LLGLLQKRIEKMHKIFPVDAPYTCYIPMSEVLKDDEEMRKEFPELLIVTEDAEVADILKYVETVYHWREKWLGNSEQK